jgi:hypothetical protein
MGNKQHVGIIHVDPKLLLNILQFEDGKLRDISMDYSHPHPVIKMVIEHPEMPAMKKGDQLMVITPRYTSVMGDGGEVLSILRDKITVGAKK